MRGRLPDFLIIGAMKCGTSSLHDHLASHPDLFMSDPKEPNFFSDDDVYARGIGWYRALFEGARPDQLCGESSTHYTKRPTHPLTVDRMRAALSDVKLIYVLRDPLERLVSQYIHEWTRHEVSGSIQDAVRSHERFVAYSLYATQLRPYLHVYPRDRILLVLFERLLAHPQQELARILRFLELPESSPSPGQRLSPTNLSRDRLRKSPLRDRLLATPGVRRVTSLLPTALRSHAKSLWQMRRRPELPPDLRREIAARIDADLEALDPCLDTRIRCDRWTERALAAPAGAPRWVMT